MFIHLAFILCFSLNTFTSASDVIELNDDDFSRRIQNFVWSLVMFYSPECGRCAALKPEFERAASLLLSDDHPVILAKVDCTEGGHEVCEKFSISGYPTLKIFIYGDFLSEYNGPHRASEIIKFMQNQIGSLVKPINNQEQLETFLQHQDVIIVGFFKTDSSLNKILLKIANQLKNDFPYFGITDNKELVKSNIGNGEGIILFRPKHLHSKFEPNQLKYEGSYVKDEIINWLLANKHGLVDHRHKNNVNDFKNPLIVAYYNVDYINNPIHTNYWRNRILKIAQNYASDFTFAISLADDFPDELTDYGNDYKSPEKPIVYAHTKDNEKYAMHKEFNTENFDIFLKKLKTDELKRSYKSESVPITNDEPVKVAVTNNFDEVVINNGVDTLIEFYAPWCGYCRQLAPIWNKLGEKMVNEDIAIVKMDATSNMVPSPYEVKGYPAIYWVSKNNKYYPKPYNGGRTLNDFIKFIAKHATHELKGYHRNGKPKTKYEL